MMTSFGQDEIEHRFGSHKATIEGPDATMPKHRELREKFKEFATFLDEAMSISREKSLMFTELEMASMWAHKAIAKEAPLLEE